ncbi:protein translocase subunit SecF [Paenibacillus sp. GD4]|uniref:protein translocase subunit SecF n=1 Tax=Paenibacillus sp. GD4 TaxID=3068890 RepID=UPI0027969067|nr:protein translocase subunit SecF [Paenibacillus sp. GD4]MDQ1912434.1 protein translocase subunit SecF [Paenibacillus sp. GD4]
MPSNENTTKIRYDFVKNRKLFYTISLAITIIGLVMLLVSGMNYGVDFSSGTSMDISVGKTLTKEQAEKTLMDAGIEKAVVTVGGENSDRVSVRISDTLSEDAVKKVKDTFSTAFGPQVSQEVNAVTPDMAIEQRNKAILAIGIASIAICIYVSIRFEWRFAIASIIAILHDAFVVIAFFAIFRFEVNLPFMAAVLTTIGYSINDKIVIFDRVRENLRFAKLKSSEDLAKLLNDSIWQTMARNINTVITVLIAAVCLLIFGSESIKLFALAKLVGLTSGAYSSICIAGPLWYYFKNKSLSSSKKAKAVA